MAVDERGRHELYVALEQLMGADRADALMGLLPPVGWADVATKHDLAGLEERMDLRFTSLENGLRAELHSALHSQMRTLFFGLLTALFTMASICIAAIALAR